MAITRISNIANTLPDDSISNSKLQNVVNFKNIIINGDMSIAQRGTSTSGITATGYNTVDRFKNTLSTAGTWTQSQDTDVPSGQGFSSSLKMDCTTANASLSAGSFLFIEQDIEGQNLQYLKKGTANAESLTVSFWVKSNKTGTYILELYDADNDRHISKSYTINSASTWEKKTITFAGDTTGAFGNDNGKSLRVNFHLAAGSNFTSGTLQTSWGSLVNANRVVGQVNLADSTSNYINITGVQLEAGTTASDFEFLPVDVNLDRCYRYYQFWVSGSNNVVTNSFYYGTTALRTNFQLFKTMRAVPTLDFTTGTDYYKMFSAAVGDTFNDFTIQGTSTDKMVETSTSSNVSGTAGYAGWIRTNNTSAYVAFDAEL